MDRLENYYEMLGIDSRASHEAIIDAFNKKAREYHPEVNGHWSAPNRFITYFTALRILGEPKRRHAYDQLAALPHDFQRPRSPHWARIATWAEAAQVEGATLAAQPLKELDQRIRQANFLMLLRTVLLGDARPSLRAWAIISIKMAALSLLVTLAVNIEFITPSLTGELDRSTAQNQAILDRSSGEWILRTSLGLSMGIVGLASFAFVLFLLAERSTGRESIVRATLARVASSLVTADGGNIALLPMLLPFLGSSAIWQFLIVILMGPG